MPKSKSTNIAVNINYQPTTLLIEIPAEFFKRIKYMKALTGWTVTPQVIIDDFIESVCHEQTPHWLATEQEKDQSDRSNLVSDYLSCAYGSRRSALRRRLDNAKAAEEKTEKRTN